MKSLFPLKTSQEVYDLISLVPCLPAETVDLDSALGRTLAGPVFSPEDLPGFARATRDGYAVRAGDISGASQSTPASLAIKGEVFNGRAPDFSLEPGECAVISTGGMLPAGADAVVMVEHTRLLDSGVAEVTKPVGPGLNTLGPAQEAARGQELLPAGRRLRPQDLGLMAALGLARIEVVRRPRVGIISTGDEVVPLDQKPAPGQVRDANSRTISGLASEAGGEPVFFGLAKDSMEDLTSLVARSKDECDVTCLSGGSSVGVRDLTLPVFESFDQAKVMVHGVYVSPGKPYIWVEHGPKHLVGLPGPSASCLITFHLFVEPLLQRLLGRPARPFARFARQQAKLKREIPSVSGWEKYVRVVVTLDHGQPVAELPQGSSGLLSTIIPGAGLVKIPLHSQGLPAGAMVEVLLFP